MIRLKPKSHAKALAALYNAAKPQGMGFLHYTAEPMTEAEAQRLLDSQQGQSAYFDYLKGRVMKVEITDEIDPRLYDRDNGNGAAEWALREADVIEL